MYDQARSAKNGTHELRSPRICAHDFTTAMLTRTPALLHARRQEMVYPTIGPSSTVTGVLFTSGCFFVLILLILIPFFTRIKIAVYPLAR
jgi:hypothetical protein